VLKKKKKQKNIFHKIKRKTRKDSFQSKNTIHPYPPVKQFNKKFLLLYFDYSLDNNISPCCNRTYTGKHNFLHFSSFFFVFFSVFFFSLHFSIILSHSSSHPIIPVEKHYQTLQLPKLAHKNATCDDYA
jgi:hypothetical protein